MVDSNKTVLVTGDVINDNQIYVGSRLSPNEREEIGTQENTTKGGAGLLYDVLEEVGCHQREKGSSSKPFSVDFGFQDAIYSKLPRFLNAFSLWEPIPEDNNKSIWRMKQPLGYGCPTPPGESFSYPSYSVSPTASPSIVVIGDGGLEFRNSSQKDAWPKAISDPVSPDLEWIVLKMSSPVGQGDLWRKLSTNPKLRERLVVIVSMDDIRREEVRVSSGISWEQTAVDIVGELCRNSKIKPLLNCRHLIINFASEGALHVDIQKGKPTFYLGFDPNYMETEWGEKTIGSAIGFTACFTAGVIDRLMTSVVSLDGDNPQHVDANRVHDGIRAGLSAMRILLKSGHGSASGLSPLFPLTEIADDITGSRPEHSFSWIEIPDFEKEDTPQKNAKTWTIMNTLFEGKKNPRPLFGVGRRVAIHGPSVLAGVPCSKFGVYLTADRKEIESLRAIKSIIRNYVKHDSGKKPLSIAVFGPPGAGKSFGIKQIAKGILGKNVPILEFNLSQFDSTKPDSLIDAFHKVRDSVLTGATPVIFWDEFDSKENAWLQYLLAPMQDGEFLEGQINHPIGKCIFVFAGGTSYDKDNFGPKKTEKDEWKDFRMKKGPDFMSRLSGYLNVLGPNRRPVFNSATQDWNEDLSDVCYPIRRALLLRSMLRLKTDEKLSIDIDRGILSGLIETKKFFHGARSFEKVLEYLRNPQGGTIRRSDLPSEELLSMHVDTDDFYTIINRDLEFQTHAEKLAPTIHEFYRELGRRKGWLDPDLDKKYEELPVDTQEDNRAAGARIAQLLDLVGLKVVRQDLPETTPQKDIQEILDANLEMLAEAEHNDWMDHKVKNGWSYGEPRNNKKKIHNCLKPFLKLSEKEKEKDRNSVRKFTEILKDAKYIIEIRND